MSRNSCDVGTTGMSFHCVLDMFTATLWCGCCARGQSGLHTNFAHASPESNVNPAGHPQSSHGSIDGPVPGGVMSQIQASRESSAAQMGGNAEAPAAGDMDDDGQSVVNSSGGADRENG